MGLVKSIDFNRVAELYDTHLAGPGNDHRAHLPLKALADEYRVVFYDRWGAGLSERVPAEELGIDDYI